MWGSWEEWRLPWNALYERRINELKKKDIFSDGKVSGSQESKDTTPKPHTRDLLGGKNPVGWLPLGG